MDEKLALEIVANRERIAASRGVEIMTRLRVIPTNQNWPYCVSAAEFYILALKHEREKVRPLVELAEKLIKRLGPDGVAAQEALAAYKETTR